LIYLDTSVLLVYTLTEAIELERATVRQFFAKIDSGLLSAATSFYALHEVFVFALENSPDFETGSEFGKAALQKILEARLRILPFLTRTERR
jgi:predicted nucleic acid-binding protein